MRLMGKNMNLGNGEALWNGAYYSSKGGYERASSSNCVGNEYMFLLCMRLSGDKNKCGRKKRVCLRKWALVSHACLSTNTNSDPLSFLPLLSLLHMSFTDLPPEILLRIVSLLEICDVARIRQVPLTS